MRDAANPTFQYFRAPESGAFNWSEFYRSRDRPENDAYWAEFDARVPAASLPKTLWRADDFAGHRIDTGKQ